jgi:hypothetical protein
MILGATAIACVVAIELPAYPLMKSFDIGFVQNTRTGGEYECYFHRSNEFKIGSEKAPIFISNLDFARINLNGIDVDLKLVKQPGSEISYYQNSDTSIKISSKKVKSYAGIGSGATLYDAKLTITHKEINKTLNLRGFCGT